MRWEISYHRDDLQRAIMELPPGIRARYIHLSQRMLAYGPDLGLPHTRAMGEGLFELRLQSREGIGRVFFGVLSDQRIVMLHAFVKKTRKTPGRELKIARRRLEEARDDANP